MSSEGQQEGIVRQQLATRLIREVQAKQAGLEEIHMPAHDPSDSIIELLGACDTQKRNAMWSAIQAYAEKYARSAVILNAERSEHTVLTKDLVSTIRGGADALTEAGKAFAIDCPRAARPNLYELHANALNQLVGEIPSEPPVKGLSERLRWVDDHVSGPANLVSAMKNLVNDEDGHEPGSPQ